jgi:predicted dehydrogenase
MRGFLSRDGVRVVAVCDVDTVHRNRARDIVNEKYGNKDCSTYNDFRELLARDDIDAVSIVLPDHWHAIPAVMAARAGKDIFSQKPLAYSIAEGRAICDAVKRYGAVWQTHPGAQRFRL